jgi:predicted nucleotide-binding protein
MAKVNILYAENKLKLLGSVKEMLEREGYNVIPATNPEEAKNILHREQLDLAILDIRLKDDDSESDKSGLLLARDEAPHVPKIILTALDDPDIIIEALTSKNGLGEGTVNYLLKKDLRKKLIKTVRSAIKHRIFIVHGHDKAAKLETVQFIKNIDLRPVVLSDELDRGDTIIENFERYSNVSAALVLLTPDDVGKARKARNNKFRARQNVIFELGYFIGKLGRKNVRVLIKGEIEIPSDFHSVFRIKMDDSGGWRIKLAKELAGAGLKVNLSKILE